MQECFGAGTANRAAQSLSLAPRLTIADEMIGASGGQQHVAPPEGPLVEGAARHVAILRQHARHAQAFVAAGAWQADDLPQQLFTLLTQFRMLVGADGPTRATLRQRRQCLRLSRRHLMPLDE